MSKERTGRKPDAIPGWMVNLIVAIYVAEREWPSAYWVSNTAKWRTGKLWGGGKAKRALRAAHAVWQESCEK